MFRQNHMCLLLPVDTIGPWSMETETRKKLSGLQEYLPSRFRQRIISLAIQAENAARLLLCLKSLHVEFGQVVVAVVGTLVFLNQRLFLEDFVLGFSKSPRMFSGGGGFILF